jgi:16S rRNA (adenine(1408)-N(1))-methyltransferase
MRIVIGKKVEEQTDREFAAQRAPFPAVLIDIGTGDGRFAYRYASEHPETLVIGLDPVRENMREISAKAARKPSRGGLSNCMFVQAAVENLPRELVGIADLLTINYPWGSLLASIVKPESRVISGIVQLAKPGASLTVQLNYSPFADESYLERLKLPHFDEEMLVRTVAPALRECGVKILSASVFKGPPPEWTSWGKKLVAGSDRTTMEIHAIVRPTN